MSQQRHIKTVVVFCGASPGSDPDILRAAEELGRLLGQRGYDLIYGGGDMGLMGVVAKAARDAGASVKGIIPKIFHKAGGNPQGSLAGVEEHIVETMLARKDKMILEAGVSIALPGGFGTMDEIYEMAVVQELKVYATPEAAIQPMLVVNVNGFYDGLALHHRRMQEKGFLRPGRAELVTFVGSVQEAVDALDRLNAKAPVPAKSFRPPAASP